MRSLFATPLTWARLWALITVNKGHIDRGVYLNGKPVQVRHFGVMHPMYLSPRPWSICYEADSRPWNWEQVAETPSRTYHDGIDDFLMRDLIEMGNLTYDDYSDGIEVQYKSNGT